MLQEHAAIIAEEINDTKRHVAAALKLFDDGATIPFVARYRKEATGSMTETMLRTVWLRHQALTELDKRKQYVIETIKGKGELTPEFKDRILAITDATLLEDLFLPYKPHRRTRAQVAREAGLEPLAKIIMAQQLGGIKMRATCMARKLENVFDGNAAIAGALDIIAEWVSESEKARAIVRAKFLRNGMVS
ncbi:MAG: Tex-like N-terminal domain-containing protein, partial [Muribaculaceae bacterium]